MLFRDPQKCRSWDLTCPMPRSTTGYGGSCLPLAFSGSAAAWPLPPLPCAGCAMVGFGAKLNNPACPLMSKVPVHYPLCGVLEQWAR